MRKGYINVRPRKVDDRIKSWSRHVIIQEVFKAITAQDAAAIVENG